MTESTFERTYVIFDHFDTGMRYFMWTTAVPTSSIPRWTSYFHHASLDCFNAPFSDFVYWNKRFLAYTQNSTTWPSCNTLTLYMNVPLLKQEAIPSWGVHNDFFETGTRHISEARCGLCSSQFFNSSIICTGWMKTTNSHFLRNVANTPSFLPFLCRSCNLALFFLCR